MSPTPLPWVCFILLMSGTRTVLTDTALETPATSADVCQSKINRHRNTCYWLEKADGDSAFTGSQQRCAAKGGNLATIDSPQTSEFLKDFFDERGLSTFVWIGYDERNSTWEDGTPFSWTNYDPGEPNLPSDYCTVLIVRMDGVEFEWADMHCSYPTPSLCQLQDPVRSFDLTGVEQGSTVSVGAHVVVVQTNSVISCGVQCVDDPYCTVFRYTPADTTCTLYNKGTVTKTAATPGEWFLY